MNHCAKFTPIEFIENVVSVFRKRSKTMINFSLFLASADNSLWLTFKRYGLPTKELTYNNIAN